MSWFDAGFGALGWLLVAVLVGLFVWQVTSRGGALASLLPTRRSRRRPNVRR